MNNTVITSISALVFLVIGLFIGKSNKQIEIQTVVKTNIVEKPVDRIVEKPVVEYVDKYITNVVEKVVEAEIPEKSKRYINFAEQVFNGTDLGYNDLPLIESLKVDVTISDVFKDKLSEEYLKDKIELELRNNGINVNEKSQYTLTVSFSGLKINDNTQYAYTKSLSVVAVTLLYDFQNDIGYKDVSEIWQKSSTGIVGVNILNQQFLSNAFITYMDSLLNNVSKAKDRFKSK